MIQVGYRNKPGYGYRQPFFFGAPFIGGLLGGFLGGALISYARPRPYPFYGGYGGYPGYGGYGGAPYGGGYPGYGYGGYPY
ncbi:hypothetical protein [Metabacillus arenae]|uniref:Uncharacterized protein n=1 Tax=Metabacillus arenae TaxID=2771434 RepID=A0A926NFG2_9BACI|nr:hypothetical protein [Metabacillus arenae]MBD1379028.1 hypothetical protein [Metabacillus arenae]